MEKKLLAYLAEHDLNIDAPVSARHLVAILCHAGPKVPDGDMTPPKPKSKPKGKK